MRGIENKQRGITSSVKQQLFGAVHFLLQFHWWPADTWLGHCHLLTSRYDGFMAQSLALSGWRVQINIWRSSRCICAAKVQIYPRAPSFGSKSMNCWTLCSLIHLHRYVENWFGEGSSSISEYEHLGEVSDISFCDHDRCLHRSGCHLLHQQSWLFNSGWRWAQKIRCVLF